MIKLDLNIKLKKGDPEAFEGLFKLTHPRLMSYCLLFIADKLQADDLVQESFLSLWEKRNTIKENQSIESFLFVILRHKCLNYLRDKKFLYSEKDISTIGEIELQHLFELDFTGIEGKTIEEELIEAIKYGIEKLPEKRKEVFIKSKIEGFKNREIAEQLKISVKMVEKHLNKAKSQLKDELILKFPMLTVLLASLLS